jgi:hypothetical protein
MYQPGTDAAMGTHEGGNLMAYDEDKVDEMALALMTSHRCGKKRVFVPGRRSLGRSRIECSRRAGSAIQRRPTVWLGL